MPVAAHDTNDDDTAELLTWFGTADADLIAGRFETVELMSREMLARANHVGANRPEALLWVTVLRWYALVHRGTFGEAEALALDALNLSGDHPYGRTRAWFIDMLGTLATIRGDAAVAVAYLEEAVAVRRVDDRGSLASSLLALATARTLLGDADGADAAFLESTKMTVSILAPFVPAPRADVARLAARVTCRAPATSSSSMHATATTTSSSCSSSGRGATPPGTAPRPRPPTGSKP